MRINELMKEIVGESTTSKPVASQKLQQIIQKPSTASPPRKKKRIDKSIRKFLDLEASQSSGASADDENESDDGNVSNLFASQDYSAPSPGDYLALNFEKELEEFDRFPVLNRKQQILKRTISTPAKLQPARSQSPKKRKVNIVREARNRRLSLSEPESPIQRAKFRKPLQPHNLADIRQRQAAQARIPKKYRLSIESPFEDFKLVSPLIAKEKLQFSFLDQHQLAEVKPLPLPPKKPFPALAYGLKK